MLSVSLNVAIEVFASQNLFFLYELRRLQDFITVFFSVWTTNVAFELLTGKFGRHES